MFFVYILFKVHCCIPCSWQASVAQAYLLHSFGATCQLELCSACSKHWCLTRWLSVFLCLFAISMHIRASQGNTVMHHDESSWLITVKHQRQDDESSRWITAMQHEDAPNHHDLCRWIIVRQHHYATWGLVMMMHHGGESWWAVMINLDESLWCIIVMQCDVSSWRVIVMQYHEPWWLVVTTPDDVSWWISMWPWRVSFRAAMAHFAMGAMNECHTSRHGAHDIFPSREPQNGNCSSPGVATKPAMRASPCLAGHIGAHGVTSRGILRGYLPARWSSSSLAWEDDVAR